MTDVLIENDERMTDDEASGDEVAASDGPGAPPPETSGSGGWRERLSQMSGVDWARLIVTFIIVGGATLFVFITMQPKSLFSDTTPTGGDMSAHVWGPAYLKDNLLPQFRLTGWSPDWYAGFPAYTFYMVIPSLAIALLSFVLPYGVAFKLVAVSGVVSLPVCCYLFGRLNKLPFPVPALMAVGGTIFLYDRSFSIYGGNVASTLAGEFAYSISLSLAVLFLGIFGHTLRTGRHRGWAALVLALAGLCHVIPAIFVFVGALVWLAVRPSITGLKAFFTVGPVAALLVAWWYLPFVGLQRYQNHMGWDKLTEYDRWLFFRDFPDSEGTLSNTPMLQVMVVLAAIGFLVGLAMRQRAVLYLGAMTVAMALFFRYQGEWMLWNARILPFYYLLVDMLALAGLGLLFSLFAKWFAREDKPLEVSIATFGTALVSLFVFQLLAFPMFAMPFGTINESTGSYSWNLGPFHREVDSKNSSFLRSWIDWNFKGLEGWELEPDPNKPTSEVARYDRSYPEFFRLISTLREVSAQHGCGRSMWEYEEAHNRFGSTMEPMMLPHFTDGCIGSMEGLYFESSATTPYHFINSTELSTKGSAPRRDLPYSGMPPSQTEFERGVQHLQRLGVKYYLAIDDLMKQYADANQALEKRADSGPWSIYEVSGSELVSPLPAEPAVLTGQATTGDEWLATSMCWYMNSNSWIVPLTADGPESWQRVERTREVDPDDSPQTQCASPDNTTWGWFDANSQGPEVRQFEEQPTITNIKEDDNSISFDVDKVGVPVLVKASHFPNWKVDGAEGPYRATPNQMIVVPTSNHVELHYGRSSIELVSWLLTLIGIGLLVWLFRARPLAAPRARWFWGPVEDPERFAAAAAAAQPIDQGYPLYGPFPQGPPGPQAPPGGSADAPPDDLGPAAHSADPDVTPPPLEPPLSELGDSWPDDSSPGGRSDATVDPTVIAAQPVAEAPASVRGPDEFIATDGPEPGAPADGGTAPDSGSGAGPDSP